MCVIAHRASATYSRHHLNAMRWAPRSDCPLCGHMHMFWYHALRPPCVFRTVGNGSDVFTFWCTLNAQSRPASRSTRFNMGRDANAEHSLEVTQNTRPQALCYRTRECQFSRLTIHSPLPRLATPWARCWSSACVGLHLSRHVIAVAGLRSAKVARRPASQRLARFGAPGPLCPCRPSPPRTGTGVQPGQLHFESPVIEERRAQESHPDPIPLDSTHNACLAFTLNPTTPSFVLAHMTPQGDSRHPSIHHWTTMTSDPIHTPPLPVDRPLL